MRARNPDPEHDGAALASGTAVVQDANNSNSETSTEQSGKARHGHAGLVVYRHDMSQIRHSVYYVVPNCVIPS